MDALGPLTPPTVEDPPKGDGPALLARYTLYRLERNRLENWMAFLLNRLRDECPYPDRDFHCKRCGYDWTSRLVGKPPRACPRCHSVNFDLEPILRTARRPTDPPNPKWGQKKVRKPRAKKQPEVEAPVLATPPTLPDGLAPPPRYVPPESVRFGEEVADADGTAGKSKSTGGTEPSDR